ncbi:hypothetical protein BKA62DRAFT_703637 [Auriculariales sp. MPI-PUGE-AT-0066]|nr:hypothetical protein BKA62DRAFT_703637 [Auriculariales sp. MPI-PUGE-AT-0066]
MPPSIMHNVAILADEHHALTRELDALDLLSGELPGLESQLAIIKMQVEDHEKTVFRGRSKLHKDWRQREVELKSSTSSMRGLLSSKSRDRDDTQYKAEHAVYQDALQRWNYEEEELVALRRNQADLTRRVIEARDRIEPRERLHEHLDHMYSILFDGVTPENPEDDRLEWEVKCAVHDHTRLSGLLDPTIQVEKTLREALSLLVEVERYMTLAAEVGQLIEKWFQTGGRGPNYDRVFAALGLSKRFMDKYLPLIDRANVHLSAAREDAVRPRKLETPPITLIPTFPSGHELELDGHKVFAHIPRGTLNEEDVQPTIQRSVDSVRLALEVLTLECESAQRRLDRLNADIRKAYDGLRTTKLALHAMRRAMFVKLAAQAQARSDTSEPSNPAQLVHMPEPVSASEELPPYTHRQ